MSRAGRKLAAALDHFGLDPAGWVCLDAGASTGGFTDCLLQRGAARVYAVDVGYGQLDARLRADPRVVVMERVNVRHLAPDALPERCALIVADLSFISLAKAAAGAPAAPGARRPPAAAGQAAVRGRPRPGRQGRRRCATRRAGARSSSARSPRSRRWGSSAWGLSIRRCAGAEGNRETFALFTPARERRLMTIRRVGVVAKAASREAVAAAHELTEWLTRRGLEVHLDEAAGRARGSEPAGPVFPHAESYDLVIVLGGDGTLLSVARNLANGSPILGVNLGTLGFLTEINRGELYPGAARRSWPAASRSRSGRCSQIELLRAGNPAAVYRVLNDAVVAKSALSRIIELALRVDGHLVAQATAPTASSSRPRPARPPTTSRPAARSSIPSCR